MTTRAVAVDLETTGLDLGRARIVEMALVEMTDGAVLLERRLNPGIPIEPDATAVHGITDADVKDCEPFGAIAADVQGLLTDAILGSYNGRRFDAIILDRQLRENGQRGLALDTVREIDLYEVRRRVEPMTFEGAMQRYCGRPPKGAHGALADTEDAVELYWAMQKVHGLTLADMVEMTHPDDEVDRSGKLRFTEEGQVVFAFGKHEGARVLSEPDYVRWMRSRDFPADTMRALGVLESVRGQKHVCLCPKAEDKKNCHEETHRPVCSTCAVCQALRKAGVRP